MNRAFVCKKTVFKIFEPSLYVLALGALLGCATAPKEARRMSSVDEVISCRTAGVMDSGYAVTIQPGDVANLQGQVTTIAIWGADQTLYQGPFSLEILPNSKTKTCAVKLKSVTDKGGAQKASSRAPVIESSADGQSAVMTFPPDTALHELRCQLPKKVVEEVQNCQGLFSKAPNN